MVDHEFLTHVYRYAEALQQRQLTDAQKTAILSHYLRLDGSHEHRATKAVRQALGMDEFVEEIRKSANLSNTQRLLQDLRAAAARLQAKGG